MIRAQDAIRVARSLIGTPYRELDCINLIKKVIRTAPGGVPGYTTAGTNSLWYSYGMSAKYKDLLWRQIGRKGASAGMIAFKMDCVDFHHAGIVTEAGTVVHASSVYGKTVETPLDSSWHALAVHRYIETATGEDENMESYNAKIRLNDVDSTVNVRNGPSTGNRVIGRLTHGAPVIVQAVVSDARGENWAYVTYGDSGVGYVSMAYLERVESGEADDVPTVDEAEAKITIVDSAGNTFAPVGDFRVLIGGVD